MRSGRVKCRSAIRLALWSTPGASHELDRNFLRLSYCCAHRHVGRAYAQGEPQLGILRDPTPAALLNFERSDLQQQFHDGICFRPIRRYRRLILSTTPSAAAACGRLRFHGLHGQQLVALGHLVPVRLPR